MYLIKQKREGTFRFLGIIIVILLVFAVGFYHLYKQYEQPRPIKTVKTHQSLQMTPAAGIYEHLEKVELEYDADKYKLWYNYDGYCPCEQRIKLHEPNSPVQLKPSQDIEMQKFGYLKDRTLQVGSILGICLEDKQSGQLEAAFYPYIPKSIYANPDKIPVWHLSVKPEDWHGFEDGIYVYGKDFLSKKKMSKWKEKVFKYDFRLPGNFQKRGSGVIRATVLNKFGIRSSIKTESLSYKIHGNMSRGFLMKSIRLIPIQHKQMIKSQQSILRNGGQGFYKTMINDVFISQVAEKIGILSQKYCPTILWINGVFWGYYNHRSYYSIGDFQRVGLDAKAFTQNGLIRRCFTCDDSQDNNQNKRILQLLKEEDNFKDFVQKENIVNYVLINWFFNNKDWYWNTFSVITLDNKVYFFLKDMDYTLNLDKYDSLMLIDIKKAELEIDKYIKLDYQQVPKMIGLLANHYRHFSMPFSNLMKDTEFRERFKERRDELLENEFKSEALIRQFNELYLPIEQEILLTQNRWSAKSRKDNDQHYQKVIDFLENREESFLIETDFLIKQFED